MESIDKANLSTIFEWNGSDTRIAHWPRDNLGHPSEQDRDWWYRPFRANSGFLMDYIDPPSPDRISLETGTYVIVWRAEIDLRFTCQTPGQNTAGAMLFAWSYENNRIDELRRSSYMQETICSQRDDGWYRRGLSLSFTVPSTVERFIPRLQIWRGDASDFEPTGYILKSVELLKI